MDKTSLNNDEKVKERRLVPKKGREGEEEEEQQHQEKNIFSV